MCESTSYKREPANGFQTGRLIALIGVLGLMFVMALSPGISFTEDLGRHLLMGRIIVETGSVPDTNFLTYTAGDFPTVEHHWLSQVLIYAIHGAAGLNGLIVWKAGMLSAALGLAMFTVIPRRGFWLIYFTGILSAVILGYRSDIRPELFSYLFLALYLWLFEKTRQGHAQARWWIIPLAWIWVNAHILFIFGLGMAGAFALEQWWNERSGKTIRRELIWMLSVVAVSCINPNGFKGILVPFTIFSNFGIDVVEILPPAKLWNIAINPMLLALPVITLITAGAILGCLIRGFKTMGIKAVARENRNHCRLASCLIATAALGAAWSMSRSVPLLVLIAPAAIAAFLSRGPDAPEDPAGQSRRWLPVAVTALALVLNVGIFAAVLNGCYYRFFPAPNAPPPFGFDDESRYSELTRLARDYGLEGPVFTDFRIGSLVEYELYPEPGYADNRPEAFPEAFWKKEYKPALKLGPEFDTLMETRQINAIIVSIDIGQAFIYGILSRPEWVLVHLDEITAVFVRRCEQNRQIIEALTFDLARVEAFEQDISERISHLGDLPFWRRQIQTEIVILRLYALVCIGQPARAWPYIQQMHQMYPDYDAVYELIFAGVPRKQVKLVEPLFARRARWPLSAKHVLDWGTYLHRNGKREAAKSVFHRGRFFFPLDPDLKKAVGCSASTGIGS